MLNRKLKKLTRDPKLFFSDMLKKQKKKIEKVYSKKIEGKYQYTIVSAVYNVEQYLDDFFNSIICQKLSFNKNIFLIMVDDGSTDGSASIIKKWQYKYPNNIQYIWKENGGQASARNVGLDKVKTEWVTFVDPDDFLNAEYFSNIDNVLIENKDKNIKIISCNIIMYHERGNVYKDTHPLNFKFNGMVSLKKIGLLDKTIQLSSSSALFKYTEISNRVLYFDENVKPNFEDAHFIARYLDGLNSDYMAFLKESVYYYRKRHDESSTLDKSWTKVERFTNVLTFGYINILELYNDKYGCIPIVIQNTILYEMIWYIRWLDNRPERMSFLDDDQKKEFIKQLIHIFSYIDCDVIMKFNLAGCWFYHKWVMLSFFKKTRPDTQIVYVDRYDKSKNLIRIRYFTDEVGLEQFVVDGVDTYPIYIKNTKHDIADEKVITERWVWIPIQNAENILIKFNCARVTISVVGKQFKNEVPISSILNELLKQYPKYNTSNEYKDSWVLMDRDFHADDNAEHLYRYIRENHPERKIYFALRKESRDWDRLRNEGFSLLDFGSEEHRLAIGGCQKVISSHANYYVTNLLGKKMLAGRHFVFLQHGITKDDISSWLNTKDAIDCFITASPYEYESVCGDDTRYYYSRKELCLTGFPRYDSFFNDIDRRENLIIIMPTWRSGIVGAVVGDGDAREFKDDFRNSDYAQSWGGLLNSQKLKELSLRFGYKIVFFPHVNIFPYIDELNIPGYIDVFSNDVSIQDIFKRAALMITDYSSVAFDMAIQNKQTIYYQFDEADFFSSHNYTKGYFDYRENGFGPVCNDEDGLFSALADILERNCIPNPLILDRIDKTFAFRDNQNCKRTYDAITALDEPLQPGFLDIDIVHNYAEKAVEHSCWDIAEERWRAYLSSCDKFDSYGTLSLIKTLRMKGDFGAAMHNLELLFASFDTSYSNSDAIEERAMLNMAMRLWDAAIEDWALIGKDNKDNELYCICLAYAKRPDDLNRLNSNMGMGDINSYIYYATRDWGALSSCSANCTSELCVDDKSSYVLLLKAHAFLVEGDLVNAGACLNHFSNVMSYDVLHSYEMIRLAFYKKEYAIVIKRLKSICNDESYLSSEFLYYLVSSLISLNKKNDAINIMNSCSRTFHQSNDERFFYGKSLILCGLYKAAVAVLSTVDLNSFDSIYSYAISLKYIGEYERAFTVIKLSSSEVSSDGWKLRSELAQLNECWDEAYFSWGNYLRCNPVDINPADMSTFHRLKLIKSSL